jgi:hypothetical protein
MKGNEEENIEIKKWKMKGGIKKKKAEDDKGEEEDKKMKLRFSYFACVS